MKAEERIDRSDSGRPSKGNNRKVRPVMQIGDLQVQFQIGIVEVEFGWGMENAGIKFNRRFSFEALMRPEFIVPGEIESKLMAQFGLPQRYDDSTGAF